VAKIADSLITKGGTNTESFYEYLISKYIAPSFTFMFKSCGVKNPNKVTLVSFVFLLAASFMVLFISMLDAVWYRTTIAVLIQLSFIFDCSDGQLARITGTSSKLGAWLDRVLDRVGEFIIFTCFGIMAWCLYGSVVYLYLGITVGYGLSLFTMAMSLSDSIQYDKRNVILQLEKKIQKKKETEGSSKGSVSSEGRKHNTLLFVLSKVFFFLNFGIGERYLYLSFFIVINHVDIMLYIASLLTTLRFLSIAFHVCKKLRRYDNFKRQYND